MPDQVADELVPSVEVNTPYTSAITAMQPAAAITSARTALFLITGLPIR
jgi:hypothetical protein